MYLHCYSHYSILRGIPSPKKIVEHAKKLGLSSCAITDINNVSGCIEFYKAAQDEKIKPIIGAVLSLPEGSILTIAKNRAGYNELLKIVAKINSPANNKSGQPLITLEELGKFDLSNIICITGHEGSNLYKSIITNFRIRDENIDARPYTILKDLKSIFNNVYIELQYSEQDKLSIDAKKQYEIIGVDTQTPFIACPRVYYLDKEDKELHHILLSIDTGKEVKDLNTITDPLYNFFDKNYQFYMPTIDDFTKYLNKESIDNCLKVCDSIEDYKLAQSPNLPRYECPDKLSNEEYFLQLCREGWQEKVANIIPKINIKNIQTELNMK